MQKHLIAGPIPARSTRVSRLFSGAASAALLLGLAACGGGGGDATTPEASAPPVGSASATLSSPASGKTPWNRTSPIAVSLRDSQGALVSGTLTCASGNPTALTVTADCSSVVGRRLGTQTVTVSAGSVSANVGIKVIPQAQPIGTQGANSDNEGYNLVVTPQGQVLAWGWPYQGVLGQGSPIPSNDVTLPIQVKDAAGTGELGGVVAVAGGSQSALALTEDGEVWSWGNINHLGRPAATTNAQGYLPGKVRNAANSGNLTGIVAVSVGGLNSVALADDGTVYSWGFNSGQTGPDPKRVPGLVNAVGTTDPLTNVVQVSAGWNWTAALTADGRVVTWGNNSGINSALGQGSTASLSLSPGFVIADDTRAPITDIVSLSAGYQTGMALTAGGEVYAWGANSQGQAGLGIYDSPLTRGAVKVRSADGNGLLSNIVQVVAGGNHTLALDTSGRVFSWGFATSGELGDGPSRPAGNRVNLPRAVVDESGLLQLSNVASIAAGFSHSLALSNDGGLLIWGLGFFGNLGQGTTRPITGPGANSPTPIRVLDSIGASPLSLSPLAFWPNLLRRSR